MRWLPLTLAALALGACHGGNPYQGATPVAPQGHATAAELDSYPPAPRDFSRYRTWAWATPPHAGATLDGERIAQQVSAALDQRGLRPALNQRPADLTVSVEITQDTRWRREYDDVGYGPRGYDRYGYYGPQPLPRTYREEVINVHLRFRETTSGELVWQGRGDAVLDAASAEQALRRAVKRALADYPPR